MEIKITATGEIINAIHEPNVPSGIAIQKVVKFIDPDDSKEKVAFIFKKAALPVSGDADYQYPLFDPDLLVNVNDTYYCLRDELPGYSVAPAVEDHTVEIDSYLGIDTARATGYSLYDLNLVQGSTYDGKILKDAAAIAYGSYIFIYNATFKVVFNIYSSSITLDAKETVDDNEESTWDQFINYVKTVTPSFTDAKTDSTWATIFNFIVYALMMAFFIVGAWTVVKWVYKLFANR